MLATASAHDVRPSTTPLAHRGRSFHHSPLPLLGRDEHDHVAAQESGAELSRHVAFHAFLGIVEDTVDVNVKCAQFADELLAVL